MFHFGTNHHERRDGFVSFRCFLWIGGGGERNLRGRKRTERTGTGLGGGWERTLRGWERTRKRGERDSEEEETGLLGWRNKDFEEDETRTLRRRKKGIWNHVIL